MSTQDRRHSSHRRDWIAAATLLTIVAGAHAQIPARQNEVELPGLGFALKEGWRLVVADGCRFAVPAAWLPLDGRSASASDGSSVSILRVSATSNWSLHRQRVKEAFGPRARVRAESEQRVWLETVDAGTFEDYISVTDGAVICDGAVRMHAGAPDRDRTIREIAVSVGTIPPHWQSLWK